MTFISYAQNFEDVMLWRALKHVENGFYIDIGAGHPDDYSVTRAFYDRGWRGINVEPTNRSIRLAGARPRDLNIQAAVGQAADELTLFVVDDNQDLSTLDPAIAETHRTVGWTVSKARVPLLTLANICREHVRSDISFLKIDVEGAERQVILGSDFDEFRPWIVVVEATAPNSQIPTHADWEELLIDARYRFAWFDGLNRFYIANERWEHLSSAFATPPNVFDDFIRATDTEHLNKIIGAEGRAAMAEARATTAEARATTAEARATAAEARAIAAEAQLAEANARVGRSAETANNAVNQAAEAAARAEHAETLMAQAEARAQSAALLSAQATAHADRAQDNAAHSEARALAAEARAAVLAERAATAEAGLAEITARHGRALGEIAALRASTSWRLSAPVRAIGHLLGRRSQLGENRSERPRREDPPGSAPVSGVNVDNG